MIPRLTMADLEAVPEDRRDALWGLAHFHITSGIPVSPTWARRLYAAVMGHTDEA